MGIHLLVRFFIVKSSHHLYQEYAVHAYLHRIVLQNNANKKVSGNRPALLIKQSEKKTLFIQHDIQMTAMNSIFFCFLL